MKNKKIIAFVLVIIFLFWLTSCESHEQKPDALSEEYKQKAIDNEATQINTEHLSRIKKVKVSNKKEILIVDEWTSFKQESDKKINENELRIAQLKKIPLKSFKLNKKIIRLEQNNLDLKNRMIEFEEQHRNALIEFKNKFNGDISELGLELNSLENPIK